MQPREKKIYSLILAFSILSTPVPLYETCQEGCSGYRGWRPSAGLASWIITFCGILYGSAVAVTLNFYLGLVGRECEYKSNKFYLTTRVPQSTRA
jgi:hypothetical protein